MGEFSKNNTSITIFWTISHPKYDHSLLLISKMNPFSAEHLLVGCATNTDLDGEYGIPCIVVDAFGILGFGTTFLNSCPTWFLVNKRPGALVDVITALSMMLSASSRLRDEISKLLDQLETFKCRPCDRIASHYTEPSTTPYAGCCSGEVAVQDVGRIHDLSRPDALKSELELLSERPERLYEDFHIPDNLSADRQEVARILQRWYKLMLEPGYLASDIKATLSSWHNLSLEGESPQGPRKQARNDVFRLLEFLGRLNFPFAKMTPSKNTVVLQL